jgi:hypothetical protein
MVDVSNIVNVIQNQKYKDSIYDSLVYNYKLRNLFRLFFGNSSDNRSKIISDIENNQMLYNRKDEEAVVFSLHQDLGELDDELDPNDKKSKKKSNFKSKDNKRSEDSAILGPSNVISSDFDNIAYKLELGIIRNYLYKKYFGNDYALNMMNFDNDKYLRDFILDDNRFFVKHKAAPNYIYKFRLRDYYPYGVRTLREFLIFIFCIPSVILFTFIVQ